MSPPVRISVTLPLSNEMVIWLCNNVQWRTWHINMDHVIFEHDHDAVAFKLRFAI